MTSTVSDFIGAERRDCRYTRTVLYPALMLAVLPQIVAKMLLGNLEKGIR